MKRVTIYIMSLIFAFTCTGWNKITSIDTNNKIGTQNFQKDTIYILNQNLDKSIVTNYQEILEKTNSQLSLWWNPYGILIGTLGVLFTILTIIAAVVIYRQGKEYKELINESLLKHENVLSQLILKNNQQIKNIETNLDNTINEYKEKLKNVAQEGKDEINDFIKKLEDQKVTVDSQIMNIVTPEYISTDIVNFGLTNYKYQHTCSKCGFGYMVQEKPSAITSHTYRPLGSGAKTITCPKCYNIEVIRSLI